MTNYQNLHTHTTYTDGALSPEDMILAAIEKGCNSLGFSEHSYITFNDYYSLSPEMSVKYIDELNYLREKYKYYIEIFKGLELDYHTEIWPEDGLDYAIGAAHHIQVSDESGNPMFVPVDAGEEYVVQIVKEYFNGDYYAFAETYFGTITDIAQKTNADIIGHFDIITKYNFNGDKYDESHPRFIKAALNAMDAILEYNKLFEVNTGAMYRFGKTEPYPSVFLLKELYKRGGEVIMGSDSHNGDSICFAFDKVSEMLKSIGFTHIKRLAKNGFIDIKL